MIDALVGFEAEHVVAGNGVAAGRDGIVELVGSLADDQHIGIHAAHFLHLVVEGAGLQPGRQPWRFDSSIEDGLARFRGHRAGPTAMR